MPICNFLQQNGKKIVLDIREIIPPTHSFGDLQINQSNGSISEMLITSNTKHSPTVLEHSENLLSNQSRSSNLVSCKESSNSLEFGIKILANPKPKNQIRKYHLSNLVDLDKSFGEFSPFKESLNNDLDNFSEGESFYYFGFFNL